MRAESIKCDIKPRHSEPINILEEFAQHAGMIPHAANSSLGKAFSEAVKVISAKEEE